jgi:hypothetical protein
MMVSMATAVLPVWRSPMISSRWPRPIGTMESTDLRPVCTGCDTDFRQITPGAIFSIGSESLAVDRALAVDGLAEGVHHAADQLGADRHFEDAARALDGVAFGDVLVFAENDRADGVALEVQREAEGVAGEFQHFALHDVGQAVHAADAVGHGDDGAFGAGRGSELQVLYLALDQVADFGGIELHVLTPGFLAL